MKLANLFFILIPLLIAADVDPFFRSKICGNDDLYCADVVLSAGSRKLKTDATVIVEQVFGQDPQGTSWFFFGSTLEDANGIGAAGDTVRVQIPAAVTPIGTTLFPAVDVTYTVVAGDIAASNPERTVAINVCAALNANANFMSAKWKCTVAKDFALVHIESKLFNEFGTRTSWTLTCSGTTTCQLGYADIARRGKPTELSRSPNDPRQGVLAIAGSVTSLPGAIGSRFQEYFKNSGSQNMLVDADAGSGFQTFTIPTSATRDIFIVQIRCFGGGNGIKFEQFLAQNIVLTNGILFEIRSDNETSTLGPIKTTEDFKNLISSDAAQFKVDIQSGADQFIAVFQPQVPFPIRIQGAFGTSPANDDYLRLLVRDDIDSVAASLECQAWGFTKEL